MSSNTFFSFYRVGMCISITERSSSSFTRESPLLTFTNTLQMKNILVTCTVQSSYFALVELQKKGGSPNLQKTEMVWCSTKKLTHTHTNLLYFSMFSNNIHIIKRQTPNTASHYTSIYTDNSTNLPRVWVCVCACEELKWSAQSTAGWDHKQFRK